ncbi:MAG: FIG131328: Predicted ATP-dependent endonuclease of the OLD family [uncultured Sulfurovum sp.]|uniref:FIG131328: Predicted ATP-dependent endonuclease of the OLD family n=1 Tax=uncultured Sulfurovum sp. TaxID=269237 RepID=A0A6S6S9Q0_9BACT|nr:MAG: FIG131328: Predicted ATP-dependent endonuclease of the OLD family [uncultured Sulfurovum sp.]
MYLENIKLWNFRKYGTNIEYLDKIETPDLDLTFNKGLNVLIGSNDSGKTAIIDAIKLVLKTHSYEFIRPTREDFFSETKKFRIEMIFKDFNAHEASNFLEWIGYDDEGNIFLKVMYDVSRDDRRIFPSDVKAGMDIDGTSLLADAREKLNITYLKPLRDVSSEMIAKKSSRISQILMGDEAFKGKETSHDLITIFSEFNESIENYFEGTPSDDKGKKLKEKIDDYIHSFYDVTKESNFSVYDGKLKDILEKITLSIKDETNLGLGTLNRLFMATELIHLNRENYHGLNLALIEELEAHLHPQAQMQVVEKLQEEPNKQLILTTHSPSLASKVKLDNLIICNNSNAYPMREECTKLAKGDYYFLERFLDSTKSNLFFANGVILVEGDAENILIPTLAKIMGRSLSKYGVSVVSVGGVAFLRYANVFLRKIEPQITMPVSVITDVDVKPIECKPTKKVDGVAVEIVSDELEAQRVETIQEKEIKYPLPIKSFIAPYWTLEYTIALSCLSRLFSQAVYIAWKSKGRDYVYTDDEKRQYIIDANNEYYTWLADGKSIEVIAFEIYNNRLDKSSNKLSKAVVAQIFSQLLDETDLIFYNIESDDKLKYLIDAINYATGN